MLADINSPQDMNDVSWRWLWKTKLPVNVQFFMWQFCHDAIPTRSVLAARGINTVDTCPRCGVGPETISHCLFACPQVADVWKKSLVFICVSRKVPWHLKAQGRGCMIWWTSMGGIIPTIIWTIWCSRNSIIFYNVKAPIVVLVAGANSLWESIHNA